MNADFQDFKYRELTEKIIELFCKIYNTLGYGFLERLDYCLTLVQNQRLRERHLIISGNRRQSVADFQDYFNQ